MITNIENLEDLRKQYQEYKKDPFIPMSRKALKQYVGMISRTKESLIPGQFLKSLDEDWCYKGKPIKVVDEV